jgi:hypothetical protein
MVFTTAGISVRGLSRQGAEVPTSIKNRKLEIITCNIRAMDQHLQFLIDNLQFSISFFDEGSSSWGNQPWEY